MNTARVYPIHGDLPDWPATGQQAPWRSRPMVALASRLQQLPWFADESVCVTVSSSWGFERPQFELLVIQGGSPVHPPGLAERQTVMGLLLHEARAVQLPLTHHQVRLLNWHEDSPTGLSSWRQDLVWEVPAPLLLLVDSWPLINPSALRRLRLAVLAQLNTGASPQGLSLIEGVIHTLQAAWHGLCLQSAAEPTPLTRLGWRFAIHSLILALLHHRPPTPEAVLALCELSPMARLEGLMPLLPQTGPWAQDWAQFQRDWSSLVAQTGHGAWGEPPHDSAQAVMRVQQYLHRLLNAPGLDPNLRLAVWV